MISWQELKGHPEAKRLRSTLMLGAVFWLVGLILLLNTLDFDREAGKKLQEADGILRNASIYRSFPGTGSGSESIAEGEELSEVSRIAEKLNLKEKMVQLASAPVGVNVQFDRLYVEDFEKLVEALQKRGLTVKMAEMKTLPVEKERLLTASMLLVGGSK